MRRFGFAVICLLGWSAVAHGAPASEARHAIDEANAALAARPARRIEAREAFERAAAANDDATAVSEAWFRLGALDEDEAEFAHAVSHYQLSVAARSAGSAVPWPRNAANRLRWLNAHAEGNFAPLTRLSRFKRDPAHAADAEAVAALARDADAFPDGPVRAETRLLIATAWLGPLHRLGDAIREFRLVTADPAADAMDRRFAERGLVDALIANEQIDDAVREAQVYAAQLDPAVVSQLHRIERRRSLMPIAEIELAVFAVTAIVYVVRRRRRASPNQPRTRRKLARIGAALWAAASLAAAAFVAIGA